MKFKIGDLVTRKSHGNDIVFEILNINYDTVVLKGIEVRLVADSGIDDLVKVVDDIDPYRCDRELTERALSALNLDRSEYFYLPGRILHIDADSNYLERCIKFYSDLRVEAYGVNMEEDEMERDIIKKLEEYKPDILVITGHDAYFKSKGSIKDLDNYQNSKNFVKADSADGGSIQSCVCEFFKNERKVFETMAVACGCTREDDADFFDAYEIYQNGFGIN